MTRHPLQKLEGLPLGTFSLRISRIEPMRMSGWRRFSAHIVDFTGCTSDLPVLDGIFSNGGKGVQPWFEVAVYNAALTFGESHRTDLRERELEPTLFRYLHDLLEPGSHIMLWYEGGSGRKTERALTRGIPPLLTPMGSVLFSAGFYSLRNFHLPEGGHEGGRKLWGERPLNETIEMEQKGNALETALAYFLKPIRIGLLEFELDARSRAIGLFDQLESFHGRPELCEELRMAFDKLKGDDIPVETWPAPLEHRLVNFSLPGRSQ